MFPLNRVKNGNDISSGGAFWKFENLERLLFLLELFNFVKIFEFYLWPSPFKYKLLEEVVSAL